MIAKDMPVPHDAMVELQKRKAVREEQRMERIQEMEEREHTSTAFLSDATGEIRKLKTRCEELEARLAEVMKLPLFEPVVGKIVEIGKTAPGDMATPVVPGEAKPVQTETPAVTVASTEPVEALAPDWLAEPEWFLKLDDGTLYGPTRIGILREWAEQCRIGPGHQLSRDRERWIPAESIPELLMNWMVQRGAETICGPFNIVAIRELMLDGTLTGEFEVVSRLNGERRGSNEVADMTSAAR